MQTNRFCKWFVVHSSFLKHLSFSSFSSSSFLFLFFLFCTFWVKISFLVFNVDFDALRWQRGYHKQARHHPHLYLKKKGHTRTHPQNIHTTLGIVEIFKAIWKMIHQHLVDGRCFCVYTRVAPAVKVSSLSYCLTISLLIWNIGGWNHSDLEFIPTLLGLLMRTPSLICRLKLSLSLF